MKRSIFFLMFVLTLFFTVQGFSRPMPRGERPGPPVEKMDVDHDGCISLEEWETHHKKIFKELDLDSDGTITEDELNKLHGDHRPPECDEREW